MDEELEIEAKSREEAIQMAAEQLGVAEADVEIEVLEESRGMLGLGRTTLRVVARRKPNTEGLRELIETVTRHMGQEVTVAVEDHEDAVWAEAHGDDVGALIGRHGQTLDAMQLLLGIIARKKGLLAKRLIIDAEGYRNRRQKDVEELAHGAIERVLARHRPVELRPMSAFERRVVHTAAGESPGVVSSSSGTDPDRFVTISPAPQEP